MTWFHDRTVRVLLGNALPVIGAALALTACKGKPTLVDVAALEAGEACPSGGVLLSTGVDDDKDGALSADEVDATETICSGASPVGALVETTELAAGSDACVYGGVQIDAGLDDGDPGGTARDGLLQDEEIDATQVLCNGAPAYGPPPFDPPSGAGSNTIDVSGGAGSAFGGAGGDIGFYLDYGSLGGGVRLYETGSADASFDMPAVAYNLGSHGVTFTASSTLVRSITDTAVLATGEVYTIEGAEGNVYQWNGTTGDVVTGVSISAGATVTFEANYASTAGLAFSNDVHVAGTLTVERDVDGYPASIRMESSSFVMASTGVVDVSATGTAGAAGGQFTSGSALGARLDGVFRANGAAGSNGGSGGYLYVDANLGVRSAATFEARGGQGTAGNGGPGGYTWLETDYGPLFASGDVDVSGGSGTLGGGDAGEGGFEVSNLGEVRLDLDLTATGGDATACSGTCYAGDGGDLYAYAYGSPFTWKGNLDAAGGDGTVVARGDGPGAYGGDGGGVYIYATDGEGYVTSYAPMGDLVVDGTWSMPGGTGTFGGSGGDAYLLGDTGYAPLAQQIIAYGVTAIHGEGGSTPGADATAGQGGNLTLATEGTAGDGFPANAGPGGPVILYADVFLTGGPSTGTNGRGGDGGDIDLITMSEYGSVEAWDQVLAFGDLLVHGGSGVVSGGNGGTLEVIARSGAELTGNLGADGGDGTAGLGGWGGGAVVQSDGPLTVTGDASAIGGSDTSSSGEGGEGGQLYFIGMQTVATGAADASGGAGGAASGLGGNGGEVFVISIVGTSTVGTDFATDGGAAQSPGVSGVINVDGVDVTANF